MIRRADVSILAMFAALAAVQTRGFAQESRSHQDMFESCAVACSDCQRKCDACARHCAMMLADGKRDHMTTLQTCQDCAEFCAAASKIVARQGPFANLICAGCADACARCGKACEQHPDDKTMADCAAECRKCEKACRAMIAHAA